MIILFHSDECKFCIKLLEYINTNKLNDFFKFINIDTLDVIPDNITIVPTVIDSSIEAPLEGKKAFEYVVNHKYFNHPTNNVDFWINAPPPKPTIEEDKKALDKTALTLYTNLDDVNNKLKPQTQTQTQNPVRPTKQVYYKPVTKTTTITPIKKQPVVARINTQNQSEPKTELKTEPKSDSKPETCETTENNIEQKPKPEIDIRKNMALMRLRR